MKHSKISEKFIIVIILPILKLWSTLIGLSVLHGSMHGETLIFHLFQSVQTHWNNLWLNGLSNRNNALLTSPCSVGQRKTIMTPQNIIFATYSLQLLLGH